MTVTVSQREPFIDVTKAPYNATGDGVTDDTTEIQAAMTAAGTAGGGIVFLPPGTYLCSGLLIDSNVWLHGAGVDATELRSTANYPVILTRTFATNSGTNNTDSEVNFKISDLTINGMKGTYAGSNGYGIRVHGANFSLERIRVYDCNEVGIASEWSSSSNVPTTTGMQHSMEARLVDVEVHECDAIGIYWNGPHDSMWTNCITWGNSGVGFQIDTKGNSLTAQGCHSWGNSQTYAWYIQGANCELNACVGEGASVNQVFVQADDVRIIGGIYYAAGASVPIGIHLHTSAGYQIVTKIDDCTSGALKYTSDVGLGWIEVLAHQASGAAESGTPDVSSKRDIRVFTGGTGDVDT